MAADGALLELHDVITGYEEVEVLRGVSLAVRAGQIVYIIGANGAGKSTLLRTAFGMVPPRAGLGRVQLLEYRRDQNTRPPLGQLEKRIP